MAGLLSPLPAQQNDEPKEEFREQLAVHLLTVQVTAETMTGRPVTDLKRDDFRIFEDGERREMALFLPPERALVGGEGRPARARLTEDAARAAEEDRSAYDVPGLVPDAVGQADQRIVLGFDFLSLNRPHLKRAVEHCTRLLEESDADSADQAWAVVVLGADPWMLLPYTVDRVQVARALDQVVQFGTGEAFQAWGRGSFLARDKELEAQKLLAKAATNPDRSVSREELQAVQDPYSQRATRAQSAEQFASDLENRIRAEAMTSGTDALSDLFYSLGSGDGDRALVYFFRGAAQDAVEMPEGSGGLPTAERQAVAREVLDAWKNVAVIGASSGFRVFGVDVEGLSFDPGYRALHSDTTSFGVLFDESQGPDLSDLFPEDVALTLTHGTGGKLVESNDFSAGIKAAQEAAANTYVLGYQVDRPRDGKEHHVEIRVPSRPRLVLRYAPDFLDLPPRERLLEVLSTSANLPKRQGLLPLVFRGSVHPGEESYRLEVEASLPIRQLGLVRQEDDRSYGEVEFFLAIYDRAGRLIDLQSKRGRVVADPSSRALLWNREAEVPAEPGTVAVALYDRVEQRYAIASARLGS